ncbi:MAG: M23 family metallopeptidase [Gemmatimonadetes bacterium]|nr:MAG: M23 family metallopeptidase [Gemmatimonadota bacterium]
MSERPGGYTVVVVPDGAAEPSRTFRLSRRRLQVLRGLGLGMGLGFVVMAGTWTWLVGQARRAAALEQDVARLEAERARVAELGRRLEDLEDQYGNLRGLFAPEAAPPASELWLPPPGGRRSRAENPVTATVPDSWPLATRGFVTQGLLEGEAGIHPGLDIAVPSGSYIRAAGAGTVVDVGEDATYGRYVRIDHGDGFETLYAHASTTLVERGQRVRKNQVIALSGSTGRSTAPHLHFEITRNGEPVDPLSMVRQP